MKDADPADPGGRMPVRQWMASSAPSSAARDPFRKVEALCKNGLSSSGGHHGRPSSARVDADLVFKALKDADFRTRLLANPTKVYGEELRRAVPGKEIPEGVEIRIAEEAEDVFYVILPCTPPAMHLSDDALRRVARHEQTHRHPCWRLGDAPE